MARNFGPPGGNGFTPMDVAPLEKRLILIGTLTALFVAAMNQTTVTTALPNIIGDLGGLHLFSWVFTAFMLTSTTTMPLAGKLSDMFGRKIFFLTGISILMLTSIGAATSQSMEQLIVWRAIQGFGSGMMMGNAFAIIGDMFPPAERGKYQGLFSGAFGLASILGPLIGGTLTDAISWRAIFGINIPFGLMSFFMLLRFYPRRPRTGERRPVDYAGAALLAGATVPLLLALVWGGNQYAWSSLEIIGLFAVSAIAVVLLLFNERRVEEPIIPLPLFKRRFFAVATVLSLVSGMGLFGAVNYMPTFVQGVMGTSARDSGFITSPMMMGMIAASTFSGIIATRTGKFRPLIITGSVAIAGGMFFLSTLSANSTEFQAAGAMIVIGLGIGTSMPIVNLLVQNSVPHHMLGVVSSSNQFFRQIGGTLGTAIFGTIVTNRLVDNLEKNLGDDILQATPPGLLDTLQEPRTLLNEEALLKLENGYAALGPAGDGFYDAALAAMRLSLADAISVVFFFGFVFTSIGLIVSLFMPEAGALRTTWSEESQERATAHRGPQDAAPVDSKFEGEPAG